jgi:cytoskeletal protein RodZ
MNLISKNNVGYVLILLLVVILSQAKTFNFLFDTYLGRIFTIFLLLVVSYCNKILGVVFVFLIIISLNKIQLFEGLENGGGNLANNIETNNPPTTNATNIQNAINEKKQDIANSDASEVSNTATPVPPPMPTAAPVPPPATSTTTSTTSLPQHPISAEIVNDVKEKVASKSIEGFDLLGTENNIRRGKQSNSIQVNKHSQNNGDVSPVDTHSLFKENYSNF